MRGPGGMAPLLGTPKDMLSKALELDFCLQTGPVLGNRGGGRCFPRTFERRTKFLFYQKNFYEEFERH
jgi:hypothetical protein